MKKYRESRLFWFVKNISSFFRLDIYRELKQLEYENKQLKSQISILNWNCDRLHDKCTALSIKNKIFAYFEQNVESANSYSKELSYMKFSDDIVFPYHRLKVLKSIESGFDIQKKLPFVVHNGKKLYFPQRNSLEICEQMYRNYIESENICGGQYREKCPHAYQSDRMRIDENDVLVDVGCAEALLSLDVIEKLKKVYLVESNKMWIDALNATFEPYKEKVIIVNKLMSKIDSDTTITLSTLLKDEEGEAVFIKMDIEGYEVGVVKESLEYIRKQNNLKFACCTYHKENDAENLKNIFEQCGYNTEFSDGYMVFYYDELEPPFFRKGVIRAWK